MGAYRRKHRPVEARQATREAKRCTCGTCEACVDEARWERIYRERFADPDYYQPRGPRIRSTLDCF